MHKVSQYIVEKDFFDKKHNTSTSLLYSTQTSKLMCIDSHSWNAIKNGNKDAVDTETLTKLKKNKILVDQDTDELRQILKENRLAVENKKTLYFAMQPSANCSLGCGYCGQKHTNNQLKKDLHEATIEHIRTKLKKKHYKNLAISWFGAEPISGIQVIRKLTPELMKLADEFNLQYSSAMVTNGLSLSDYMANELINTHKVTSFEITLDGDESFHDARRHLKTGGKTFQQIYTNLLNLVNKYGEQTSISLRSNVDDRNKDGITPLIDRLKKDNILNRCNLYFAPIHSWGNDADQLVHSKKEWSESEIEWFIYLKENGYNTDLLYKRRKIQCIAVTDDDELIDPFGNVYNCTEVSLVPTYEKNEKNRHAFNHVTSNDRDDDNKDYFKNFVTREKLKEFPCHQCNIFPICGGACPKEWLEGRSPCPSIKYNIKERMLLSYLWTQRN